MHLRPQHELQREIVWLRKARAVHDRMRKRLVKGRHKLPHGLGGTAEGVLLRIRRIPHTVAFVRSRWVLRLSQLSPLLGEGNDVAGQWSVAGVVLKMKGLRENPPHHWTH